jgi:hypothetical protein
MSKNAITVFETETCTRCHGSGNYSYCERYGTRCFKCAGRKVTLTARGEAARAYLENLQTKSVKDLQVGDRALTHGMTHGGGSYSYIGTVTAIEKGSPSTYGTLENGVIISRVYETVCVTIEHPKYGKHGCSGPETMTFRVYGPDDKAKIEKALQYQSTLTKAGKPRKNPKVISTNADESKEGDVK